MCFTRRWGCKPVRFSVRGSVPDTVELAYRGVAQSGSASALGAEGRGFESLRPDHRIKNLRRFLIGLNPTNPHTCIFEKFCMGSELTVHHSLPVNVHGRR